MLKHGATRCARSASESQNDSVMDDDSLDKTRLKHSNRWILGPPDGDWLRVRLSLLEPQ